MAHNRGDAKKKKEGPSTFRLTSRRHCLKAATLSKAFSSSCGPAPLVLTVIVISRESSGCECVCASRPAGDMEVKKREARRRQSTN